MAKTFAPLYPSSLETGLFIFNSTISKTNTVPYIVRKFENKDVMGADSIETADMIFYSLSTLNNHHDMI